MLINNLIDDLNTKLNINENQIYCKYCSQTFENNYEYNAHMIDTDCFVFKNNICRSCFKSTYYLEEKINKLSAELREKNEYIKILENALINPDKKTGNKRTAIPTSVRQNLWSSHFNDSLKGECLCCGREVSYYSYQIGHKWPVSRGGTDNILNLTILCSSCNYSCGDRSFFEFKNRYHNNDMMT